ncbi:MAG: recombinase family protein, partial [Pseudomonadota bacterium]
MTSLPERPAEKADTVRKAIIYCRVSTKKQSGEGSGLESQEHRCREYAAGRGYAVDAVFPDDTSGGGDFIKRPGMVALLAYLDAKPFENYVVIFDDLKRYARDTEFHLKLKREMAARNAERECLNFTFEDTPEGEFIETILAAQGELERKQNRRQVIQKMKARVEQGFSVFRAPVGYRYQKSKRGGKELVPDEPLASSVREALEGFASGRFGSQVEVKRFLEADAHFPKDLPNGEIRQQTIVRLLEQPVYAGYVQAPQWGVSLRKGNHEGLISFATMEKNIARLVGGVYAPARKDCKEDFPLRGAVSCATCRTPLTAGWCKGKYKHYPYYFCRQRGCSQKGKTIARDKLELTFRSHLSELEPPKPLVEMAAAMFRDCWEQQAAKSASATKARKQEAAKVQQHIDQLLDRIVEASSASVVQAYEKKIDELERQRLLLLEQAEKPAQSRYTFDELFELSLKFLGNPCKIWDSERLELRRIVLKLAFAGHLEYCRETGSLNSKKSLPFRVL